MSTVLTGFAGCNGIRFGNDMETPTDSPTDSPIPTETAAPSETPTSSPEPTSRETPPQEFKQNWSLNRDDDWMEQRRVTEYPETDDSYSFRPDYVRTTEYSHVPSQEELASTLGGADVPTLGCAVVSKWALPPDYSNSSVGFVHLGRKWFATQFDDCTVDVVSPENVEPWQSELESGQTIGDDPHEVGGDTGRLEPSFQVTVDDDSVTVERLTYDAKGLLLGLLGAGNRVGYLAGGGWPATDTVTLHTAESGEIDVTATVSGESWQMEDRLVEVLNVIDQG